MKAAGFNLNLTEIKFRKSTIYNLTKYIKALTLKGWCMLYNKKSMRLQF